MNTDGDRKLYKIGELAKLGGVSPRTVDFYTKLGLIDPEVRSDKNYRLYGDETLERMKRIEKLKKEKYSLEEIKSKLKQMSKVSSDELVADKLTSFQMHIQQLEEEAKELVPIIEQLRPSQVKQYNKLLTPSTVACIEALMILLGKGPLM